MKLQYIQTEVLNITGYGEIKNGDIIDREDLVQSLKHRSDFKIINNQEAQLIINTPRKRKCYSW